MTHDDREPDAPLPEETGEDSLSERPSSGTLTADEKQWGMFAHLAGIATSFVGMSFLGPLLVWMIKKDESNFVAFHGKEALNFQLNILVLVLISFPLICLFFVGLFTLTAAGLIGIIVPIIAGIKANNGEWFRIPYIIRVIK